MPLFWFIHAARTRQDLDWFTLYHIRVALFKKKNSLGIYNCLCKWFTLLCENWIRLLVGVEQKDTAKPKSGRRIYFFQQVRTLVVFPKAMAPHQQTWGSVKRRLHAYLWRGHSTWIFMKGLKQRRILHGVGAKVDRVQALVDWSHVFPRAVFPLVQLI